MSEKPKALELADMQSIDAYACRTLTAIELRRQHELIQEMREALRGLEPHLDAIICYASTMNEYEPNRLAAQARAALAKAEGQK